MTPTRYHLLNLEFHDRLVEFAGNRKMASIYRRLVKELALARWRNLSEDSRRCRMSAAEHRQILKTIASGDADAAGRVLFEHADRQPRAHAARRTAARATALPRTGGRKGS